MARARTTFFCTDCGNETPRWLGQCPACQAWNTLVEEPVTRRRQQARSVRSAGRAPAAVPAPVRLGDVAELESSRWSTRLEELDFVLGGGVVPGSLVLIGGEPGVGKSTLLLQVAARLEAGGRSTLYVSGEESAAQVRLRADRLADGAAEVAFLGATDLDAILLRADERRPDVLIIDSIQTTFTADVDGAPGSVTQVRECAARLQRYAKERGTTIFVVGHVTKGGAVAGPKTLEHIVDTVLYFEGIAGVRHRMLRATKNRFGGADEIGVFRMAADGLVPVPNPSELFLGERSGGVSGSAVAATIEGTRPLLVEVQALCGAASYGAPQRATTGFDRQRLALLLAVLERRVGIGFGDRDVFLNVVGGVRLDEPAADLAVVAALVSAARDLVVPGSAAFIGEVGLGGELRGVSQAERRVAEVARMGFRTAYVPLRGPPASPEGVTVVPTATIADLLEHLW
ncbi:MAG: DNA repair protein RadA [Longimicrobiales bacterium]